MGVPKRRLSRSKGNMRFAHYRLEAKSLSICPRCGEKKLPHRVCPNCGFYGVKKIFEIKD